MDLQIANLSYASPSWPYITPMDPSTLPEEFVAETWDRSATTLEKIPLDCLGSGELPPIVQGLHQLEHISMRDWARMISPDTFGELYFLTAHKITALLARLHRARNSVINAQSRSILGVFVMTCSTYLRTIIGHTAMRNCMANMAVSRTIDAMQQIGDDIVSVWQNERCLEALLWCLFIIVDACPPQRDEWNWLSDRLEETAQRLNIYSIEQFEIMLRKFPWNEKYLRKPCDRVWRQTYGKSLSS
jgi:hypothetical protein